MREVGRLRPVSEYVFPAAENVIAEAQPGPETENFAREISACKVLWETVDERSGSRNQAIRRVYPAAENYDDACKELTVWLRRTEQAVLNLVSVPCNQEGLNQQHKNLKVCCTN